MTGKRAEAQDALRQIDGLLRWSSSQRLQTLNYLLSMAKKELEDVVDMMGRELEQR